MPPIERKSESVRPFEVLVVDDFDDNRELYVEYFELVGFNVTQASNGADALAQVSAHRPDIVLMDLSMPGMDGWETMRRLKAAPETQDLPVLILTAHASPDNLRRAREAGADDVCVKPCLPQVVHERVKKLLGGGSTR